MTDDPRPRLIALLVRLAPDVAAEFSAARDITDVPRDVRETAVDVIGHEAAERGISRDGTPNQLGRDLDELANALLDETP